MKLIFFKNLTGFHFLGRCLLLVLAVLMLNACQTIPSYSKKQDPITANKHQFSLLETHSVIGQAGKLIVESGDSLPVIARYFGLGFDEITLANPTIDPWLPKAGQTVNLPMKFVLPKVPRQGVVLNLAAKRLFYFSETVANQVETYPAGIGRAGWQTPVGKTKVVSKKANPRWVVPRSILLEHAKKGDPLPKIVAAGPNNPLGEYALRLGIPGYLIHGTNKPYGVGMAISHGCVRLYPENIASLFKEVKSGTPVRLINQPFLIGWKQGELYIQIYDFSESSKKHSRKQVRDFNKQLKKIERLAKRTIDWPMVKAALKQKNGVAVSIFSDRNKGNFATSYAHPTALNQSIKPRPLRNNSWRLKVVEYNEQYAAQRFAAMLNHQGPRIPAHVISARTGFIVAAGPFDSIQQAQSSLKRLNIDFDIKAELIPPGKVMAKSHHLPAFLFDFFAAVKNQVSNSF